MDEIMGRLDLYLDYCPELDMSVYLPDNAHSYGVGRREGYEVHFHCNDGYVACGSSKAICGKDGQWRVEGDMFCIYFSDTVWVDIVEYTLYSIPCVPSIGTKLVLSGKPKDGETMSLDIKDSVHNNVLHNAIRMGNNEHVIDSTVNGQWNGMRYLDFSFQPGISFVLEVEWVEEGFQITVDGDVKYTDYPHYGQGVATGWTMYGKWETATVTYILP